MARRSLDIAILAALGVALLWAALVLLRAVGGGWPGDAAGWFDLLLRFMPPLGLLAAALLLRSGLAPTRSAATAMAQEQRAEFRPPVVVAMSGEDARATVAASLAELLPRVAEQTDMVAARLARMEADSLRQLGVLDAMLQRMRGAHEEVSRRMDSDAAQLSERMASIDARSREATEAVARRAYVLDAAIDAVLERSEDAVTGIERRVGEQLKRLEAQLTAAQERLDRMEERGSALIAGRTALLEAATEALRGAALDAEASVSRLTSRASEAAGQLAGSLTEHVAYFEEGMGQAAGRVVEHLSYLEEGAGQFIGRIDEHLNYLREGIGRLEIRMESLAEGADGIVREELAVQSRQLLEALGELSVDIARLLAVDLPEAAWTDFLAGDRGIFARRLSRAADDDLRRGIARLHAQDAEFRGRATAYVARFEQLLARVSPDVEGAALGSALLSSDFGKLYGLISASIPGASRPVSVIAA